MKKISVHINGADKTSRINPEIYGHFAEHLGRCVYDGIYVGEGSSIPNVRGIRTDVVEAFKKIKLPVLRWPGGCFADIYHWKDGVGENRPKILNYHWGDVTEDNSFGTHEFFDLCGQVGCEPYLAGNLGSGTIRELSEWVEYITFGGDSPMADMRRKNGREQPWKLKYLGIGNENWGCGGEMRPEYYADEYKRYQTFCRNLSGNQLFKIACGPNAEDYNWTEVIMKNVGSRYANGISLHYYTVPGDWQHKGSARDFTEEEYYRTLLYTIHIEDIIRRHAGIMDRYDPEYAIGLIVDEWGCWYDVEEGTNPGFLYQQNTMRDAIVAACNLNIFNRNSRRVVMANLAQAVNVLQSLVLTEGEKAVLTPTYYVFELYKTHQGGENLYCHIENQTVGSESKIPMVSCSASVKDGKLTVTVANCSADEDADISAEISGFDFTSAEARILTAECHALNDFDSPDNVVPKPFAAAVSGNSFSAVLPPCSVASIILS